MTALIPSSSAISQITTITPAADITPTAIPARDLDLLPTFETLSFNDDCILPCWWGFESEKASINEIMAFIEDNDLDRRWEIPPYTFTLDEHLRFGEPLLFDFQDSYNDVAYSVLISFGFDSDLLKGISIKFYNLNEWVNSKVENISLPQVVSQTEEIPEVYVTSSPNATLARYTIILIFREANIQIVYFLDLSGDHPPHVWVEQLCLNLERTRYVDLNLNYIEADFATNPPNVENFITPEEAYGISTEEFVQFFRDHPDECLDIAAYKESEGVTP
jgi:hypothetical protein